MNDTFPACSLLQEGRLEDETLEATNKIVRVSKWCREAWKWFTLQKTPRQTTTTKHFNNLQDFTYLPYCNIYSAFILRYKISQRQTLCVSGWPMKEIKDVIQNKFPRHYLPPKLVRISNMTRFPQSRSKNIIIGILTLGFLEVVEMEYDEGSEWPITLGRLDVFV